MIKKNILAIAITTLLSVSSAVEIESFKTASFIDEPLKVEAKLKGDGEVKLAEKTEYLKFNYPVLPYDLTLTTVENEGGRVLLVTSTESIDTPAITILVEGSVADGNKQIFEIPVFLNVRQEASDIEESVIEIDGNSLPSDGNRVALNDVPSVKVESSKPTEPLEEVKAEQKTVETKAEAQPQLLDKANSEENKKNGESNKVSDSKKEQKSKEKRKVVKSNNNSVSQSTSLSSTKKYGPVQQGETMWSIANKVKPRNMTPQKMIELIKKHNPGAFTAGGVLLEKSVLVIPTEQKSIQHNNVPVVTPTEEPEDDGVKIYRSSDINTTVTEDIPEDLIPKSKGYIYVLPEPPFKLAETEEVKTDNAPVVNAQNSSGESEVNQAKTTQTTEVKTPPIKKKFTVIDPVVEEPSIFKLLLDNMMYIGAALGGLFILTLGLIIVRRKKQDKAIDERVNQLDQNLRKSKKTIDIPSNVSEVKNYSDAELEQVNTKLSAKLNEESMPKKDFQIDDSIFDSLELSEVNIDEKPEEKLATSKSKIESQPVEPISSKPEPKKAFVDDSETIKTLDFDLTGFETKPQKVDNSSKKITDPSLEDVATISLDFPVAQEVIDETVQTTENFVSEEKPKEIVDLSANQINEEEYDEIADNIKDDFINEENDVNPLFKDPLLSDGEQNNTEEFLSFEATESEYISYPELMSNAETTQKSEDDENLVGGAIDFGSVIDKSDVPDASKFLDNVSEIANESAKDEVLLNNLISQTTDDNTKDFLALLDNEDLDSLSIDMSDDISETEHDLPSLDIDDSENTSEKSLNNIDVSSVEAPNFDINSFDEDLNLAVNTAKETIDKTNTDDGLSSEFFDVEDLSNQEISFDDIEDTGAAQETLNEVVSDDILIETSPVKDNKGVKKDIISESVGSHQNLDEFDAEQVKLDLAIVYFDLDKNLAKPLLEEVLQGGNAVQIAKAQELLSQIN